MNTNKNIFLIIIGVVAFILVFGAGYYFGSKKTVKLDGTAKVQLESGKVIDVQKVVDKIESVMGEHLWMPLTKKKASAGNSTFLRPIFNAKHNNWLARLRVFFERRWFQKWGHKEKRFKASREKFGNIYLF